MSAHALSKLLEGELKRPQALDLTHELKCMDFQISYMAYIDTIACEIADRYGTDEMQSLLIPRSQICLEHAEILPIVWRLMPRKSQIARWAVLKALVELQMWAWSFPYDSFATKSHANMCAAAKIISKLKSDLRRKLASVEAQAKNLAPFFDSEVRAKFKFEMRPAKLPWCVGEKKISAQEILDITRIRRDLRDQLREVSLLEKSDQGRWRAVDCIFTLKENLGYDLTKKIVACVTEAHGANISSVELSRMGNTLSTYLKRKKRIIDRSAKVKLQHVRPGNHKLHEVMVLPTGAIH